MLIDPVGHATTNLLIIILSVLQHGSHGCHGEEQHEVLDRAPSCMLVAAEDWRTHCEGVWGDLVILIADTTPAIVTAHRRSWRCPPSATCLRHRTWCLKHKIVSEIDQYKNDRYNRTDVYTHDKIKISKVHNFADEETKKNRAMSSDLNSEYYKVTNS